MTKHYLDRLARTISENWNSPALTDFYLTEEGTAQDTSRGNHYTYGEMYCEMLRLGDMFRHLGLQQGDHIAICGANSANWAVAYLAIAAYQGVAVTVLHSQNIEDIASQIDFSDSVCLFTDKDLWEELQKQPLPQVKYVVDLSDFSATAVVTGRAITCYGSTEECTTTITIPHGALGDLAMICFTSGSSGVSKGVMLSYRNLSVNIDFLFDELLAYTKGKTISFLPLGHIYGLYNEILRPLCIGTHINILHLSSYKSMLLCYQLIEPIYAVVVPSLLEQMVVSHNNDVPLKEYIIYLLGGKIDEIAIGGAGLTETTEGKLINAGVPIAIGYGMTECGPLISVATKRNSSLKLKSVGFVLPTLTLRFSDHGEILVKGENVMLGYYKNPEATAEKIDRDGWLHTGDAGYMDEDGYLYVTGRIGQDMLVLPNGENIHPEDIEQKLNALAEVNESVVVARDGKLVALVVPRCVETNVNASQKNDFGHSILRQINPQLPMYSQLTSVEFIDKPLERTAKQTIKRYLYK